MVVSGVFFCGSVPKGRVRTIFSGAFIMWATFGKHCWFWGFVSIVFIAVCFRMFSIMYGIFGMDPVHCIYAFLFFARYLFCRCWCGTKQVMEYLVVAVAPNKLVMPVEVLYFVDPGPLCLVFIII